VALLLGLGDRVPGYGHTQAAGQCWMRRVEPPGGAVKLPVQPTSPQLSTPRPEP